MEGQAMLRSYCNVHQCRSTRGRSGAVLFSHGYNASSLYPPPTQHTYPTSCRNCGERISIRDRYSIITGQSLSPTSRRCDEFWLILLFWVYSICTSLVAVAVDHTNSQLLRALRQRARASRSCNSNSNNSNNDNSSRNRRNSRSRPQTSRPSQKRKGDASGRNGEGDATPIRAPRTGSSFPPFSPPDAWDDSGLFTVAPRPKTVSSTGATRRNRKQEQKPAPGSPVFPGRASSTPRAVTLPASLESLGGGIPFGMFPPGELWHKGQDFRGGSSSDGFGLWPKRRRKVRVCDFCSCSCVVAALVVVVVVLLSMLSRSFWFPSSFFFFLLTLVRLLFLLSWSLSVGYWSVVNGAVLASTLSLTSYQSFFTSNNAMSSPVEQKLFDHAVVTKSSNHVHDALSHKEQRTPPLLVFTGHRPNES